MTDKNLLREEPAKLLKDQFSGLTLTMFENQIKNSKRKAGGKRYHEEIKKFALTLHFYSPKAYLFMRKVFDLPHPSSLRNWQSSVNCEPGFFKDVLENLAAQLANNTNMSDCALMIDAMAIRKQVIYDKGNQKFSGFVDYGGCIPENSEDQASEALAFLLVGLRSHWKCPIGYFFTNKLNGQIQASLVKSALSLVADYGFRVWSLTCDGTSANLETLRLLVANALEFLKTDLKHAEFENASATIVFIRTIDKIFDILNSRFAFAKGFKRPIRLQNLEYIEQTFAQSAEYLLSLKSSERQLLVFSRRKTFILGFLMTMKSIMSIAKELLTAPERPFNYVLTYKFSQDHIELLFACIRGRGGNNNNPNTLQFKYAIRNLLLKNSIVASSQANVMSFDENCTGSLFSLKWTKHRSPICEYPSNDDEMTDEDANALSESLDRISLSNFSENIIYYIAGFIVRRIIKKLDCSQCSEALILNCMSEEHDYVTAPFSLFLDRKNNGGLIKVSFGVHKLITLCEKSFRERVKGTRKGDMKINSQVGLIRRMTNGVLRSQGENLSKLFPSFSKHAHEIDPTKQDLSTRILYMLRRSTGLVQSLLSAIIVLSPDSMTVDRSVSGMASQHQSLTHGQP
eukprot:gene1042-15371_t